MSAVKSGLPKICFRKLFANEISKFQLSISAFATNRPIYLKYVKWWGIVQANGDG